MICRPRNKATESQASSGKARRATRGPLPYGRGFHFPVACAPGLDQSAIGNRQSAIRPIRQSTIDNRQSPPAVKEES